MKAKQKKPTVKELLDMRDAAALAAYGICDSSFNCIGGDGKARCKECKCGQVFIALGVYNKRTVHKAFDEKHRRIGDLNWETLKITKGLEL